ncbi:MAG: hypothetical protein WC998_00730 [Candidatus Paceibacterota bacterium]|jgi:hypothetical protein
MSNIYNDALNALGACNSSGLIFDLAKIMQELCDQKLSTAERNKHPVVILFLGQLSELAGLGTVDLDKWTDAYKECQRKAAEIELENKGGE